MAQRAFKMIATMLITFTALCFLVGCDGSSGGGGGTGPSGVFFMPVQGNPVGIPIFY